MQGEIRIALAAAVLTASCSSPQPDIQVRAAGAATRSLGVDQAEGQLALGNVALALEGFRKAAREQPDDVRALVGIAQSYDRMGRFDLSRKWFETALAVAPNHSTVVFSFANSLEKQGKGDTAASLRAEIAQASQIAPPTAPTLTEAQPVFTTSSTTSKSELPENPGSGAARSTSFEIKGLAAVEPKPSPMVVGRPGKSVTIALPPARPTPARRLSNRAETASAGERSEPRLERLSTGVVALVTGPEPVWTAQLVKKTSRSATFRFVSVRPSTRLLNAARSQGLAARTRARLVQRGWKRIEIGDAPAAREKTLVLFPYSHKPAAKRLASQFGFTLLRPFGGSEIIVLLGRDAARLGALKAA